MGAGVTASTLGTVATVTIPSSTPVPVQDEGVTVQAAPTAINFVGAGVTATNVGGVATVTVPSFTIKEAGTSVYGLPAAPAFINFFGAYINRDGAGIVVDIPGVEIFGGANSNTLLSPRIRSIQFTGNAKATGGPSHVAVNVPHVSIRGQGNWIVAEPAGIDFVGAGVTTTMTTVEVAGIATVNIRGPSTISYQGNPVVVAPYVVDFVGPGLKVTDVSGTPTVGLADINGPAYTVATLPSAAVLYRRAFVSDATAPAFGAVVVGGGTVLIPVYSDGTAWRVG